MKTLRIAALMALSLTACTKTKTDAQRAAEEREEIRERARDATIQVELYRWMKTAVRAQAAGEELPSFAKVSAALAKTERLPTDVRTPEDAAAVASTFVDLGRALYAARADLERYDEDDFPLAWTAVMKEPVPWPWYDGPAEHLLLACTALSFEVGGKQRGALDVAMYELSRAEAQPGWPPGLRMLATGSRGLVFARAGFHYAAEEELNAYVADAAALAARLDALSEEERSALTLRLGADAEAVAPAQTVAMLQAAGLILRGWNRMALERTEPAVDDFDSALAVLLRAGMENEVTDWASVVVALERGEIERAGKHLGRLAKSPHLDAEARAELAAAASKLEANGDAKGLLKSFAKLEAGGIVARALVARAGGAERILTALLGEKGKAVAGRLAWLDRVRSGLAEHATLDEVKKGAGALAEKGKEAAGEGWRKLKGKLEEKLADPVDAGTAAPGRAAAE